MANTPSGIVATEIGIDAFSLVARPNTSLEIGIHLSVITMWDLGKQVSTAKPSFTLHSNLVLSEQFYSYVKTCILLFISKY